MHLSLKFIEMEIYTHFFNPLGSLNKVSVIDPKGNDKLISVNL